MRDFDKAFMRCAVSMTELSTCCKYKVGCVLTADRRIVATGYNGTRSGEPHCCDVNPENHREWSRKHELHAEQNAIIQLKERPDTAYVTLFPCMDCAKLLLVAGVQRLVWLQDHHDNEALELFLNADKVEL